MKQTQALLDLELPQDYQPGDYIVSLCNVDAYKVIKGDVDWPNNQLLLIGEEGSGKSHLASIWQEKTGAIILKDCENFQKYQDNSSFILEDIEMLKNEEYLFHLINFCRNNSFRLLLTSSTLPEFTLTDLRSRINSIQKVLIKNPDDEIIKILFLKHFTDRQLKVASEVIDFMVLRTDRSFKSIKLLVSAIDKLSLKEKRNITIPMVKKVMLTNYISCQEEVV
jgi:chromosomal replication initiation ATPase DnaA